MNWLMLKQHWEEDKWIWSFLSDIQKVQKKLLFLKSQMEIIKHEDRGLNYDTKRTAGTIRK